MARGGTVLFPGVLNEPEDTTEASTLIELLASELNLKIKFDCDKEDYRADEYFALCALNPFEIVARIASRVDTAQRRLDVLNPSATGL